MTRASSTLPASAETFARLGEFDCVIDARSPAEYADDHLPGAINCPVLDDAQRVTVGTLYKQDSPFEARKIGAALVAENIARHLRERFLGQPRTWRPLIYCWRGGQRSGAMTTVFRQIGWDARQLEGGYKAFRRHVVEQLASVPKLFSFRIVKGATGSAKTRVLQEMARQGAQVIDLEALAGHKGSVLGLIPDTTQPSQKTFETALLGCLQKLAPDRPVFIEAESRKIGAIHLPDCLIESMRASPGIAIDAPRQARVEFLLRDYDYFVSRSEKLLERLEALRPLRGEKTLAKWGELAGTGSWAAFVDALLLDHYDPLYLKSQAANYDTPGTATWRIETKDLDEKSIAGLARSILASDIAKIRPEA